MGLISFLCSLLVVAAKKSAKTAEMLKMILLILTGFAIGALLGDAGAHLIPEGFGVHGDHEHEDDDGHAHHEEDAHEETTHEVN